MNRRKSNGKYWTVQYVDEDGMFYTVGSAATFAELAAHVAANLDQYPPGEGRFIQTR